MNFMDYRVLERRRDDGVWLPCGVAFEQSPEDIFLFIPRWRGGVQLYAPSVSALPKHHLPTSLQGDSYQWGPEKSWLISEDFHPVDIINSEIDKKQEQMSLEKKLASAAKGDKEMLNSAIEEIYKTLGRLIFRFVNGMIHDETLAQDVTQEIFIGVLCSVKRYDPKRGSVQAWVFGIARHFVLRELRDANRWREMMSLAFPITAAEEEDEITVEEILPDERSTAFLADVEANEIFNLVQQARHEALTPLEQAVITCLYDLGLTYEETATVVKLGTRQNVTYHRNKALNKLRRWFLSRSLNSTDLIERR